jgi:DNA-binding transcriptional regulator YdaS (Cro superfamily)
MGMEPGLTPIQRACKVCGSGTALALAINKSPQFVSQMVQGGRPVPAELCPLIERVTLERGGVVRCEELRPDVQWSVLREAGVEAKAA